MLQGSLKSSSGQIFRVMVIGGAIVYVIVYLSNISLVKETECITVFFGTCDKLGITLFLHTLCPVDYSEEGGPVYTIQHSSTLSVADNAVPRNSIAEYTPPVNQGVRC